MTEEGFVGENRRKTQIRWSLEERRKPSVHGGYLRTSICPRCSRAIVKNGELCDDCKKPLVLFKQINGRY